MPMSYASTLVCNVEPLPPAAGSGLLNFVRSGDRTVVSQSLAASPLKLLNPRNHGHAAWVFSSSYGGGLLGGDQLSLDVRVQPGATAMLSTQAATKVYRSDLRASQSMRAEIADGGLLVVAPDPVICFADSEFSQRQTFSLTGSAGLVLVDWLSAGRRVSGERWAFRRLESRIEIYQDGRKILHESLLLDPEHGNIAGQLGRFNTLALAVVCGPRLLNAAHELAARVMAEPLQRNADLIQSAGMFGYGNGALLRIAGTSIEDVGRLLRKQLGFVCTWLGEDPWARKW